MTDPIEQTLSAPAKINLGLRVKGLRPNGYHELESVFLPLDLEDEVHLRWDPGAQGLDLEVEGAFAGALESGDNLTTRAARAYLRAAVATGSLSIRLEKAIPVAAGLGGGSSDAAAVLLGLAEILAADLAGETLESLALSLGADVPFFLDPRPSWVTGVGEKRTPLSPFPELWLVLANPGVQLSTSAVFKAFDGIRGTLTEPPPETTMRAVEGLLGAEGPLDPAILGPLLTNDLEPVAIRLCPPIARLRDQLRELGALGAAMSGSGATVYGIFAGESQAEEAAGNLDVSVAGHEAWVRVVKTRGSA